MKEKLEKDKKEIETNRKWKIELVHEEKAKT